MPSPQSSFAGRPERNELRYGTEVAYGRRYIPMSRAVDLLQRRLVQPSLDFAADAALRLWSDKAAVESSNVQNISARWRDVWLACVAQDSVYAFGFTRMLYEIRADRHPDVFLVFDQIFNRAVLPALMIEREMDTGVRYDPAALPVLAPEEPEQRYSPWALSCAARAVFAAQYEEVRKVLDERRPVPATPLDASVWRHRLLDETIPQMCLDPQEWIWPGTVPGDLNYVLRTASSAFDTFDDASTETDAPLYRERIPLQTWSYALRWIRQLLAVYISAKQLAARSYADHELDHAEVSAGQVETMILSAVTEDGMPQGATLTAQDYIELVSARAGAADPTESRYSIPPFGPDPLHESFYQVPPRSLMMYQAPSGHGKSYYMHFDLARTLFHEQHQSPLHMFTFELTRHEVMHRVIVSYANHWILYCRNWRNCPAGLPDRILFPELERFLDSLSPQEFETLHPIPLSDWCSQVGYLDILKDLNPPLVRLIMLCLQRLEQLAKAGRGLYIHDAHGIDILQIRDVVAARRELEGAPYKLYFDWLDYIPAEVASRQEDWRRMATVSKILADLAVESNCMVVTAMQGNRTAEKERSASRTDAAGSIRAWDPVSFGVAANLYAKFVGEFLNIPCRRGYTFALQAGIASIEKFRHGSSNPGKFFLLADYAHGFLWADAGYQQYYRRAADELAGHEKKRGINPAAIADRALKTCLLGNPQAAAGNWRGLYRLQVPEELPVSSESDGTYADAMGLTRSSYDDLSTGDADDIAQTIAFSRVVADRRGRRHADPEDDAVRL